jgi:hypothetical protein
MEPSSQHAKGENDRGVDVDGYRSSLGNDIKLVEWVERSESGASRS